MKKIRKPLLFTLCLLPVIVLGAYFVTLTGIDTLSPEMLEEAVRQVGSRELVIAASCLSPVMLALVSAFFGYILSARIGLMRPFRAERTKLYRTLVLSLLFGAVLSLDAWTFAKWIPQLEGAYASAGTFDVALWLASILYGGVIEELMMRLFVMSLLAFLMWKCFRRNEKAVPTQILVIANVLAAALFAAGHLPSTAASFGTLTPMLLIRCFLMNGAFGLLFGRLYRKYGIQYAMICHALLHVVSRTIWLIAF